MNLYSSIAAISVFAALTPGLTAATLQVGPGQPYAKPCAAIAAAAAGDTIEIDAAGSYNGDVCLWHTNNLTIRGVNGRPHIDAAGKSAQNKGLWVLEGNNTVIENVELSGATSTDKNGAAVRLEGVGLTLRQVYFHDNQDGLLTNSTQSGEVLIEYSEFANNGANDGQSHNIYVGRIDKFTLQYSYSHSAVAGHLVKSRAANNYILFNRLSSESANTSYQVNLPNGGLSYVVGNVIQQGPNDPNKTLISYLEEGTNAFIPSYDLFIVNNTIVNTQTGGTFVKAAAAANPMTIKNNIFAGNGIITNQTTAILANNLSGVDPQFVNPSAYDYRLTASSPAIDAGADPGTGAGVSLASRYEYVHRNCGEVRNTIAAIDIGAYEYGGAGTQLACTVSTAPPTVAKLSLSPSTVVGGSSSTLTISLTNAAPAGGIAVALASANGTIASTAASVTIPAGSSSVNTAVYTSGVSAATPVTLTASYGGDTKTTTVTVNPAPTLAGISLSPASVAGGKSTTLTVTLTSPAPSAGVIVSLTSSNATLAPCPTSVTVAAGATSASVTISPVPVKSATDVTFTANASGISKTASLRVVPPVLAAATVSPSSVTSGTRAYFTVTLDAPAPKGGIYVPLSSSAPTVASTPATVYVPADATSATATISTFKVSSSTAVTLTAMYGGITWTALVTVN